MLTILEVHANGMTRENHRTNVDPTESDPGKNERYTQNDHQPERGSMDDGNAQRPAAFEVVG